MSTEAIKSEILQYATAEAIAKERDFAGNGIAQYLEDVAKFADGDSDALPVEHQNIFSIYTDLLNDDEDRVLAMHPHLASPFLEADQHQASTIDDPRDLDYFLEHGVEVTLDGPKLDSLRDSLDLTIPLSPQVMRQRIVNANGFDGVRINFLYHDVLDHIWAFDQIRNAGITERYEDFLLAAGSPIAGFLFSRQSELVSGIGYNTRRYMADSQSLRPYSIDQQLLAEHIGQVQDQRTEDAVVMLGSDGELSDCFGFVVKGALSSLLLQRSRWGMVKRVEYVDPTSPVVTNEPVSLLDPLYLSFMAESVQTLLLQKDEYEAQQTNLNLTIEAVLRRYFATGQTSGRLLVGQEVAVEDMPSAVYDTLIADRSISTDFFN